LGFFDTSTLQEDNRDRKPAALHIGANTQHLEKHHPEIASQTSHQNRPIIKQTTK
jgi:hypothetical protein